MPSDANSREQFQKKYLGSSQDELKSWDNFVDSCSVGTFFHLSGWKTVIEQAYGHKCWFMYATRDEHIIAVLPLVEVKSRLFGHSLVSTPFCVAGGVASENEDAMLFLEEEAIELAEKLGVGHLELRYPFERSNPKLIANCKHSNFSVELADDDEAILAAVKKKQRAAIRHSLKGTLTHRIDDDVDTAFEVYSESVRNLGTPVFAKQYFHKLRDVFGSQLDVLTVESDNKPVSSVLSFYYKGQVMPFYGGGVEAARGLKSNDYMYYKLMCSAKNERQCTMFDFGRSKDDSGAYKYKKTWGMEPQAMHYKFYLAKSDELPNLSPNNPKYQFFIQMWKKLPVSISRMIGPYLSKYLG